MTNRKSLENLKQWLGDVVEQNESFSLTTTADASSSTTGFGSALSASCFNIPLLLVGTKLDQAKVYRNSLRTSSEFEMQFKCDEINLVNGML
jgi:hypothetical protein